MAVEQGWYYYPGDPEGTVRRWNGSEWVGYPSQPPPGDGANPSRGSQQASGTTARVAARPFKNQVRLAPYALLALLGLAGTVVFAIRALIEVRGELEGLLGRERRFLERDTILLAPFEADAYRQLLFAGAIGGVLFLAWVWRSNANLGAKIRPKRNTRRAFGVKWFVSFLFGIGLLYLLLEATFRTVLGPVIARMRNGVERSSPGGSGGAGLTIVYFLWWALWALSGATFLLSASALSVDSWSVSAERIETWGNLASTALMAHVVSLLLGMVLVVSITIQQDRRLG